MQYNTPGAVFGAFFFSLPEETSTHYARVRAQITTRSSAPGARFHSLAGLLGGSRPCSTARFQILDYNRKECTSLGCFLPQRKAPGRILFRTVALRQTTCFHLGSLLVGAASAMLSDFVVRTAKVA